MDSSGKLVHHGQNSRWTELIIRLIPAFIEYTYGGVLTMAPDKSQYVSGVNEKKPLLVTTLIIYL